MNNISHKRFNRKRKQKRQSRKNAKTGGRKRRRNRSFRRRKNYNLRTRSIKNLISLLRKEQRRRRRHQRGGTPKKKEEETCPTGCEIAPCKDGKELDIYGQPKGPCTAKAAGKASLARLLAAQRAAGGMAASLPRPDLAHKRQAKSVSTAFSELPGTNLSMQGNNNENAAAGQMDAANQLAAAMANNPPAPAPAAPTKGPPPPPPQGVPMPLAPGNNAATTAKTQAIIDSAPTAPKPAGATPKGIASLPPPVTGWQMYVIRYSPTKTTVNGRYSLADNMTGNPQECFKSNTGKWHCKHKGDAYTFATPRVLFEGKAYKVDF